MNTVIISPSGKFYGSEQTLYTFLTHTKNRFDVYVNHDDGSFINILSKQFKHKIYPFKKTLFLYIKLFIYLLFGKYNALYCNEGGHIRYLRILAFLLPKRRFIIHIRLTEDTSNERIGKSLPNLKLISVSKFIADLIFDHTNITTTIISSPTREIQEQINWHENLNNQSKLQLGIIGRITPTKGIGAMLSFINHCEANQINNLELNFFGDIEEANIQVKDFLTIAENAKFIHSNFHGFKTKNQIFESIDVVLHFNSSEPLGVIFFEALNFSKPFIGFNAGGIGNIAQKLAIQDLMVNDAIGWENQLIQLLANLSANIERYKIAQLRMLTEYSIENYCESLEYNILANA